MSKYIEPYIVMVLGILLCDYKMNDITDILVVLIALIVVSLMVILRREKLQLFLLALSTVAILIFPPALPFFPAVLYTGISAKKIPLTGAMFLLVLAASLRQLPGLLLTVAALGFFSGYLAYEAGKRDELVQKAKELRDSSAEREIRLNQQNQQLLTMQQDQIHLATLTERNRIAREIHDNVGHMLSRGILQLGAITAVTRDEQIKPLLSSLKGTLDEAMTNIRTSVHDLHDESIDLEKSVTELCTEFTFCPVELHCETGSQVPKDVKYCFIAIVKEALNNIQKHSNATKASVYLHEHPGFFQLLIEDNGSLPPGKKDIFPLSGIGLINMSDRVKALGGMISITGDDGFKIFISVPKNK